MWRRCERTKRNERKILVWWGTQPSRKDFSVLFHLTEETYKKQNTSSVFLSKPYATFTLGSEKTTFNVKSTYIHFSYWAFALKFSHLHISTEVFKSIFRLYLQKVRQFRCRQKINQMNFDQLGVRIWQWHLGSVLFKKTEVPSSSKLIMEEKLITYAKGAFKNPCSARSSTCHTCLVCT